MLEFSGKLLDYGVLGIFVIVLLYVVNWLANKMDDRITEDRKVFEEINKNLTKQNQISNLLLEEFKASRVFFEKTIDHERESSKYCYDTIYKLQQEKRDRLIKIEELVTLLDKKVDRLQSDK